MNSGGINSVFLPYIMKKRIGSDRIKCFHHYFFEAYLLSLHTPAMDLFILDKRIWRKKKNLMKVSCYAFGNTNWWNRMTRYL